MANAVVAEAVGKHHSTGVHGPIRVIIGLDFVLVTHLCLLHGEFGDKPGYVQIMGAIL